MELSTEATAINNVAWNYGNLVSTATEICLHKFAFNSIQTLYLEHMFPGEHQYLVVLAVMETLLSWQLRNTFIILAFEGV